MLHVVHSIILLRKKRNSLKMSEDPEKVSPPQEEETAVNNNSHPPSFFTDERGNLKAVNFVVRCPCLVFWTLIIICIGLSFLLNILVWREAEGGNPFTAPENEFDLSDIRSIQYDSLRLALDEVQLDRKEADKSDESIRAQSEPADICYWVFEAEDPSKNLFGSAESIKAMKEAYDVFLEDEGYANYCLKSSGFGDNSTDPECDTPLSPLSMYYASSWDSDLVASVIEELKDAEKRELFNSLALCYVLGLYCELVPTDVPQTDLIWALSLGTNIRGIVDSWDMKGDLVENYTQVTELASYLIQIDIYKEYVDFGYDKTFSIENPASQYSRGIVFWGGPLEERNSSMIEDDEALDETEDDERKK